MKHGKTSSFPCFIRVDPWLMLLLLLLMLDDDHLVRQVGLPGSQDDEDMPALMNVGDGGRRGFAFSLLPADEFDFGVFVDSKFLLDGRRRSGRSRSVLILVRTNFHGENAPVRSHIGYSSMSRMKFLLTAARIGRGSKSG